MEEIPRGFIRNETIAKHVAINTENSNLELKMEKFDIFAILFTAFGIYCAIGLKKDYADYKKSNHYLEYIIFIRNIAVVFGSIIIVIYELFRLFS